MASNAHSRESDAQQAPQPRQESPRARALRDKVNQMIELEIARCRALHGEDNWRECGEWVTGNIVTAAKLWLVGKAERGEL